MPGIGAGRFFAALRNTKWIVVLCLLLTSGLAYLFFPSPPIYRAEALVKVPPEAVETQMEMMKSERILGPAGERLNYSIPLLQSEIRVVRKGASNLVAVLASTPDASSSVRASNTVARTYRELVEGERRQVRDDSLAFLKQKMAEAEEEWTEAEERLEEFRLGQGRVLAMKGADRSQLEARVSELERDSRRVDLALQLLRQIQAASQAGHQGASLAPMMEDFPAVEAAERELQQLLQQQRELQSERVRLLRTRTEQAPDVQKLDLRLSALGQQVGEAARSLENRYRALREEFEAERRSLLNRIRLLETVPSLTHTLQTLQRRVQLTSLAWADLQRKLQELELQSVSRAADEIWIQEAKQAQEVRPLIISRVLMGALVGFGLGCLLVFLLESSLFKPARPAGLFLPPQGKDETELRVLGSIPRIRSKDPKQVLHLLTDPEGAASETYGWIREQVELLLESAGEKGLLITSAVPGEGKTSFVCNLALSFARAGRKVVLVDANLRSPTIDQLFKVERFFGVSEVLRGVHEWRNVLKALAETDLLSVLTAGRPVANIPELLSSGRAMALWRELQAHFDYTLVDSPAALSFPEAASVALEVHSTLLVQDLVRTDGKSLERVKESLERVGVRVLGRVVLETGGDEPEPEKEETGIQDQELDDIMGLTEG